MTRGEERLRTHSAVLQSVLGQLVSSSLQTGVPRTGHVSSRILLSVPLLRLFSLLLLSRHVSGLAFCFLGGVMRTNRLCRCSCSTVGFCVYITFFLSSDSRVCNYFCYVVTFYVFLSPLFTCFWHPAILLYTSSRQGFWTICLTGQLEFNYCRLAFLLVCFCSSLAFYFFSSWFSLRNEVVPFFMAGRTITQSNGALEATVTTVG